MRRAVALGVLAVTVAALAPGVGLAMSALPVWGPSPEELAAAPRVRATVVRALDGGSAEVEVQGQRFVVRYLGVSVPEHSGTGLLSTDWVAEEAQRANRELVEGMQVVLERDEAHADDQGRLLRWVWVGEELVSETLVRRGLAQADVAFPNNRYQERLEAAVTLARQEGRGLWASTECDDCAYLALEALKQQGKVP